MEERREAVEHPWDMILERPDVAGQIIWQKNGQMG
jgi:hypothetical protein